MKALRLAAVLLLGAALAPELARFGAERRLYRVSSAVLLAAEDPRGVPGGPRTLLRFADEGRAAARALPGDVRPLLAAALLERLAGRAGESRDVALRALDSGERPEVLLAVWQADRLLGDAPEGRAALLRAAWLAPGLVGLLRDPEAGEALATARETERVLFGTDSSHPESSKEVPAPLRRR